MATSGFTGECSSSAMPSAVRDSAKARSPMSTTTSAATTATRMITSLRTGPVSQGPLCASVTRRDDGCIEPLGRRRSRARAGLEGPPRPP